MIVQDIMTREPACCTPELALEDVARLMIENDCGCIPVIESFADRRPIGMITDRDIICRTVAQDRNPIGLTAADCMTRPCLCVDQDASLTECCELMQNHQVRRVAVVDGSGACCGIVAQADVAQCAPPPRVAEVLRRVSEHTEMPASL